MDSYYKLLKNNAEWASGKVARDPEYFKRLSSHQHPEIMWIGCSDSRVPADRITGTEPGEIFVHRNISNMVLSTDLNLLSVLQFAVEILNVKHIIVCGHHNCGGIKAAMQDESYGLMDQWIWNIKDVYRIHRAEIEAQETEDGRRRLLTELNVKEQVLNLAKTSIIQNAWSSGKYPHLHGWVYDVGDGVIHTVFEMPAGTEIDSIYKLNRKH
ncbi:MAG: carbonic anhydrase [Chitinophagaceae bacterium]|nr:carbonic anhydrase [Chitinophagaceae bacterium]